MAELNVAAEGEKVQSRSFRLEHGLAPAQVLANPSSLDHFALPVTSPDRLTALKNYTISTLQLEGWQDVTASEPARIPVWSGATPAWHSRTRLSRYLRLRGLKRNALLICANRRTTGWMTLA